MTVKKGKPYYCLLLKNNRKKNELLVQLTNPHKIQTRFEVNTQKSQKIMLITYSFNLF